MPLAFFLVVVLPTLIAVVYYLFLASPRYVSEARFLVRSSSQAQPSSLGVALQGVGLSSAQTDAFAVHEFIHSRDGLRLVQQRFDMKALLERGDFLSGYPRAWDSRSEEGLFKAYERFITVGYDSSTGISTLRVEAFTSRDAQGIARTLLDGGETLVNRLNERSSSNAVSEAESAVQRARQTVTETQRQLTAFRSSSEFINPDSAARESAALIGELRASVADLVAQRAQLAAEAPSSPQLPAFDHRIAAYQSQIAAERAGIAGEPGALAPKVGTYENLTLNRELADKDLATATAALATADQDARRQKLYLERVVSPDAPDRPAEPRRLRSILTVFISALLAYAVGWLIYAGVKEHRQT